MSTSDLPKEIQNHIQGLAGEMNREKDSAFIEELGQVWQRKADLFTRQVKAYGMELLEELPEGDGRGFLVLSYSGSLLSVGPDNDDTGGKWMEYSSIKLRTDVPDIVIDKMIAVEGGIRIGSPVKFFNSRVSSSSPAYLLAVCPAGLDKVEQDKLVREVSIFVTTGFMKYNRSLVVDRDNVPDQFTMKSMTRYLAKKHGLTGNEARLIIDDYLTLIETGMLLGESVPMGKIGRFNVKIRDAQKARSVKHPATGEEMIIEAKPPMGVPKISFSSYIKERSAELSGYEE